MIKLLKNLAGKRCIFPLYHVVSDFYMPHVDQVYRVTSREGFIRDLDVLLKHFKPLSMWEIMDNPNIMRQKHAFHLTFDDGLREIYDVVVPVLLQKGVSATFFINTHFIDNQELFFRYKQSLLLNSFNSKKLSKASSHQLMKTLRIPVLNFRSIKRRLLDQKVHNERIINEMAEVLEVDFEDFLKRKRPYMSSAQLESLVNNGFTIGAHSLDHPYYTVLSLEQQITQTSESIRYLETNVGTHYRLFAFPFTDHRVGRDFFDYFYGTNKKLDFSFGTAGLKDDTYKNNLQRIPVEAFKNAKAALTREYGEYVIKRMLNLHKIKR